MKVIVNYPELDDDKLELENRAANFHATLLIEKIKHLNISDDLKKKLLYSIMENLKNQMCE